jgi:thymidine kinase
LEEDICQKCYQQNLANLQKVFVLSSLFFAKINEQYVNDYLYDWAKYTKISELYELSDIISQLNTICVGCTGQTAKKCKC